MAMRTFLLVSALAVVALAASQKQIDSTYATIDSLKSDLANLKNQHEVLKSRQTQQNQDMDTMWLIINFIVMLFMIPAIGFREMGVSRVTDSQLYILKYLFLLIVSAICFWITGYGAIFGNSPNDDQNAFIGNTDYILVSSGASIDGRRFSVWSYEWTKAAISTAVLFSVFGERVSALGYFLVTIAYTAFIYPVSAHWLWGESGWLSVYNDKRHIGKAGNQGALDYAGSAVVHICGGAGALAALIFLGARKRPVNTFHNPTLVLVGILLTWFSFYGFIAGETWGLSGASADSLAHHAGKITFTTTLAAAGGGIGALILSKVLALSEPFNYFDIMNGIVAGLVTVSSGAGLYDEYAGFLLGLVAGVVHIILARLVDNSPLDDGHRTVTVHFVNGWLGMIGTGLWARKQDILRGYPHLVSYTGSIRYGIFYGGGAQLFGLNLLASIVVTVWSFAMVYATLWVLDRFEVLRLTEAQQENGADDETAVVAEGKLLDGEEKVVGEHEPHHV